MKNYDFTEELSMDELRTINGGDGIARDIGRLVGRAAGHVVNFIESMAENGPTYAESMNKAHT